jgi:hypothetical protein
MEIITKNAVMAKNQNHIFKVLQMIFITARSVYLQGLHQQAC